MRRAQRRPGPARLRRGKASVDPARAKEGQSRVGQLGQGEADVQRARGGLVGKEPPRRHALQRRVLSAMLKRVALFVVACAFTGQALAALFDDEEARRRIELLRQSLESQNRSIDERLAKIEKLAGDRSSLLEFAS